MALGSALPTRMPQSSGTTYYVAYSGSGVTGNDTRTAAQAQNRSTPWATIEHAFDVVSSGDTIKVLDGSVINIPMSDYGRAIYIYGKRFSASNPVTLTAETKWGVTITNTQSWGESVSYQTFGMLIYGCAGIRIKYLKFSKLLGHNVHTGPSAIQLADTSQSCDDMEISECLFEDIGGDVIPGNGTELNPNSNIWIYRNMFRPTGTTYVDWDPVSDGGFPAMLGDPPDGENWWSGGMDCGPGNPSTYTNHYKRIKGTHWIYIYCLDGFVIANNIFVGACPGNGLHLGAYNSNGYICNNTFYGKRQGYYWGSTVGGWPDYRSYDGQAVITQWGAGGNIEIWNNIFSECDGHPVNTELWFVPNPATSNVSNNLAWNCDNSWDGSNEYVPSKDDHYEEYSLYAGGVQFTENPVNRTTANPLFTNPTSTSPGTADWSLQDSSPAVGVSVPDWTPTEDFFGTSRSSSAPSLGAVEWVGSPSGIELPIVVNPGASVTVGTGIVYPMLLQQSPSNGRYFQNATGQIVPLVGGNDWQNLQDYNDYTPYDWDAFLSMCATNNWNCVRLWASEHPCYPDEFVPMIWERTGPGTCDDGLDKFDLDIFNSDYFDRLRSRVESARAAGIYVSVMLFAAWPPFTGHPFKSGNNINGVSVADADTFHSTSAGTDVIAYQRAYVRQAIDTLNDLDNVLWEVGNELGDQSVQWQYDLIDYIKSYEDGLLLQHPVGMTSPAGETTESNSTILYSSSCHADWVSPLGYNWNLSAWDHSALSPPEASTSKVSIADNDHIDSVGIPEDEPAPGRTPTSGYGIDWVWKEATRGHNIWLLGATQNVPPGDLPHPPTWKMSDPDADCWTYLRPAVGWARSYLARLTLENAVPNGGLTSTGYALAWPGNEYLVYQPSDADFNVTMVAGTYDYEWCNAYTGEVSGSGSVVCTTGSNNFSPPSSPTKHVLLLVKQ